MENPVELSHNVTYVWLAAGVILLAMEALGATGVGLMFAGLGALIVGSVIPTGLIAEDAYIAQFILFFATTAIFACLLWKPLQQFRVGKSHPGGYSNIVGDTAYVGSNGLTKQAGGEVTWSGTIMKAKLISDAAVDRLDAGAQVVIVEVSGNTLIVKPK